ncbi:helix-turn-helix domain-containing protein [Streptomyces sp. NPDC001709]
MVIVACDAGRQFRLRPYDRARCTLVYLRKHDTVEQIAAGFGISTATVWRYVNHTIGQLAVHTVFGRGAHQTPRGRLRATGRHCRRDRPGAGTGPYLRQG